MKFTITSKTLMFIDFIDVITLIQMDTNRGNAMPYQWDKMLGSKQTITKKRKKYPWETNARKLISILVAFSLFNSIILFIYHFTLFDLIYIISKWLMLLISHVKSYYYSFKLCSFMFHKSVVLMKKSLNFF